MADRFDEIATGIMAMYMNDKALGLADLPVFIAAALRSVAAIEREACAEVARQFEHVKAVARDAVSEDGGPMEDFKAFNASAYTAMDIAQAIEARKSAGHLLDGVEHLAVPR